ncbi:hypothetical protein BWD42_18550 [Sphingobacterium sp. CZ-UAM]|nr:hypothetical protein BWD42_18550 [Sphingobacterium sp. CZ-UAM]
MLKILLIKQSYQIQHILSKQGLNFFPIKESSQIAPLTQLNIPVSNIPYIIQQLIPFMKSKECVVVSRLPQRLLIKAMYVNKNNLQNDFHSNEKSYKKL